MMSTERGIHVGTAVAAQAPMIVGRAPARPTIVAEAVAISGEALLVGLVVLAVLVVLGVAAVAGLVYLGAYLTVRFAAVNRTCSDASRPGTREDPKGTTGAALAHDPAGVRPRRPRSTRRPIGIWQWVACTVASLGLVVALPSFWYLAALVAPLLGASVAVLAARNNS